ncbi:MAG: hypothetical protein ACO3ND_07965 [Opitutales bacterium]
MDAVAEKVGAKRKPMMRRKGPPAVVIAIGAPKPGPMMGKGEDEGEMSGKMSKDEKRAMLEEKIAALKAELALLEDEEEMDDEEMADEAYEGGSEDED